MRSNTEPETSNYSVHRGGGVRAPLDPMVLGDGSNQRLAGRLRRCPDVTGEVLSEASVVMETGQQVSQTQKTSKLSYICYRRSHRRRFATQTGVGASLSMNQNVWEELRPQEASTVYLTRDRSGLFSPFENPAETSVITFHLWVHEILQHSGNAPFCELATLTPLRIYKL